MRPQRHIIASTFSGIAIWVIGRNLPAGIILFLGGVMPDIDHVVEFIIHRGIGGISVKKVYEAFSPEHDPLFDKLYLFAHSIELVIILWLAAVFINNIYLIALAAGYALHLIMDVGGNHLSRYFYFFIWRMHKKFEVNKLFKKEVNDGFRRSNN